MRSFALPATIWFIAILSSMPRQEFAISVWYFRGRREGKRYMVDRDVVEIHKEPTGELRFIPAVVRQYNLGRGIEVLEREKRRTILGDSSPELFWQTFDQVISFWP